VMDTRTGLALERAASLPACRRHLLATACAVVGPKVARAPATPCRRSGHISGDTLPELAARARRGPNLMRSGYIRWHSEVRTESSKSHGHGPISNFVRGVVFDHQTTNLSPNRMANWVLASHHSRGGRFHASTARLRSRYSSFIAASSPGKWPRVRTARRSFEFNASIAFVV
jgi:hypothetical protein